MLFLKNKVPRLFVAASLLFSTMSYSNNLILCDNGRIKIGDSYDKVSKAQCGVNLGHAVTYIWVGEQRAEHKILKTKLNDGANVAFIFIDGKLVTLTVFD